MRKVIELAENFYGWGGPLAVAATGAFILIAIATVTSIVDSASAGKEKAEVREILQDKGVWKHRIGEMYYPIEIVGNRGYIPIHADGNAHINVSLVLKLMDEFQKKTGKKILPGWKIISREEYNNAWTFGVYFDVIP